MPEGIDRIGTTTKTGADQVDGAVKDKPAGIVIGPCACGQHVGRSVNDPDRGLVGKLSDKFFRYLRQLAR